MMQKIRAITIESFINQHQRMWMNAENAELQSGSQIQMRGNSLYIGDNYIIGNRIPELFKMLDKRINITLNDPADDFVKDITELLLKKRGGLQVSIFEDEIFSFGHKVFPYTLKQLCKKIWGITESDLIGMASCAGDNFVTIYSIDQTLNKEPKKDDIVCAGLAVRATIEGFIEIYPFSFRMWCANGAILRKDDKDRGWSFQFNGGGKDSGEHFFDYVKKEYKSAANSTLEKIDSLKNKNIDTNDVSGFLIQMVDKGESLPRREVDAITRNLTFENRVNAYDFWNYITERLTYRASKNPERGFKYFMFGGAIGGYIHKTHGPVNCKLCGRPFGSIEINPGIGSADR